MTETTTKRTDHAQQFALIVTCPSAPGQVAALVRFLDERGCYIDEFDVFDDEFTACFFVRCIFHAASIQRLDVASMREEFTNVANRFDMAWKIHDMSAKPKVLVMVSKLDHCLADLQFRWRMDELKMDIVGVASDHPDLEPVAAANGIPFHHLPLTADTKPKQEAQVLALVKQTGAELVVLARYMQVFVRRAERIPRRARNQHSSLVPARIQGREALSPGAYARGEADRRDSAFRDR
ncbi:formyltetrahydrofolate deformylase [Paraburkholderia sp. WC7.3g]